MATAMQILEDDTDANSASSCLHVADMCYFWQQLISVGLSNEATWLSRLG